VEQTLSEDSYLYISTVSTVKEAGRTPPPFPFIFFKPNTTIHDHGAPVVIPQIAQDSQADYEGELVRQVPCFYPVLG
jgi:2-keto-4-pentenoate hydratase/2-oxohepta-3-ene-1,7-dioic acid hydratase in catechol pathway